MRALYEARLSDLGPNDFVKAECTACGHDMVIPAVGLLQGMRLPPYTHVLDLEQKLRCRECDARGKAMVSVKWAAGRPSPEVLAQRK
jgi:hypothetical protein